MKLNDILDRGELSFYACLACILLIPLYIRWSPPFMILWGLLWLLENRLKIAKYIIDSSPLKILFVSFLIFYSWQIFGLFFARFLDTGIDRILKRLTFLLFPMVLFYPGKMILENLNKLLRLFVLGTFIFIFYSFCFALYRSISFQTGHLIFYPHPPVFNYENYFYGNLLSNHIHPSYLSMYIILSILISLERLFDISLEYSKRILWFIIITIFIITLYFLSSRAGVLTGLVVLPVLIFYKIRRKFVKWILVIILPLSIVLIFGLLRTNDRFDYSFEKVLNYNPGKLIIKDSRIPIWKSAIGVIKNNVLFGVGTGDATEELKKEYLRRGYIDGYYDNLNAHNQYLEIFLENGLIGLIIFIWILGFMLYQAFINQNILYGLFIIMVMIFFIFETMLNRLAGIAFFPFFSFLLFHLKVNNSNTELKTSVKR